MRNIMAGFLIFLSSAAYADINLYGPGGPHTALLDAAKLYAKNRYYSECSLRPTEQME